MHTADGLSCIDVPVAPLARTVEKDYGVSFLSDYSLDSTSENYNHWVFPLNVEEGMYTSSLKVTGLLISSTCNAPGASFNNLDLIPAVNRLLQPDVSIDGLPAAIVNVYAGKPPGSYTAGDAMYIIVEFSKDVAFSELPSKYSPSYMKANASYTLPFGLPYLELNSQSYATLAGYAGHGQRKLAFFYSISTGEFTPEDGQLEVSAGATIQLNGGSIYARATGAQADLTTMPLPGTFGPPSPPSQPHPPHPSTQAHTRTSPAARLLHASHNNHKSPAARSGRY